MIWLLGIGLFIIFWLVFPPFRKFAIVVGSLIVLIIVGIVLNERYKESVSKSLIPTSQVQINNLRLNKEYSSYKLTGEVRNNSNHDLESVYMKIIAYDCPSFSITPSCSIIGQDDNVSIWINIPNNQVRAIDQSIYFNNMPQVKGTFLWSYEITGTRGR